MIQIRQLHLNHIDSHYASAIFRYLKELAIKFKDHTWLVFLDDKHRCKIGEPEHPVAAIERGKQVVVTTNETFAVSDHDFTKCSLIPSVTMLCNIPDNMEGSFYRGQVNIGLKDAAFQASSALRLGMATVGHGRSSVGHDRSEAFDRPTDLTDRLV